MCSECPSDKALKLLKEIEDLAEQVPEEGEEFASDVLANCARH